jgi:hypothetical protein
MPKYRVKQDGATLIYGKERKAYEPGDVIELTAEEAEKIGRNLETVDGKAMKEDPPTESPPGEATDVIGKEDKKGKKKGK